MKSYKKYLTTCVPVALAFVAACGEEKLPPLNPEKLFAETEEAIEEYYYFPPGTGWTKSGIYTAAISAANADSDIQRPGNRKLLVEYLQSLPAEDGTRRTKTYAALGALLSALPAGYNSFTKPESLEWSRDPSRGAGVGLVIRMEQTGRFYAVDTLEGSSSYRAGMEPGRYISKIDGTSVKNMDLEEVVGRIRGPADTEVVIEYDTGKSYNLVRGEVSFRNLLNASWELPGGAKAEYIMLRSTLADTVGQVRGLISRIGARKALILDLRRLHHGDYENCFGVANLFVRTGSLGGMRFKEREPVEFVANSEKIFGGRLYIILGENASPFAEVLAAALSVSPEAKLVGARGGGRAFVSQIRELAGGVELTLTEGLVLGPNGDALYQSGVPVDVSIKSPPPKNPPLAAPDLADPVQAYLARELGL